MLAYFHNMLQSIVVRTYMGLSEGLDRSKHEARHWDMSDMKTMMQNNVIYMKSQELVED
jgi:hypothetical protein